MTHLPGKMSQLEALKVMLKADAGRIIEVEKLGLQKIAAFILEPHSSGGMAATCSGKICRSET